MSGENKPGGFEELLKSLSDAADEVDTLAKADAPAADALGADGEDDDEVPADGDDAAVAAAAADGAGGDDMAKGGDDMVDATELLKSMLARQDDTDGVLAKALGSFTQVVSKQNALIKSLQSEVRALASQGRGRKTMLNVAEKPGVSDVMAKSQGAQGEGAITPADLLAKSNAAYAAGAITGAQLNTVDVCLRNHWPIDAGILTKIAGAAA